MEDHALLGDRVDSHFGENRQEGALGRGLGSLDSLCEEKSPQLLYSTMFTPRRWPREAWIPVVAGLLWLWCAASFGVVGFFFSLIPGCLLLTSGFSTLLYPGDVRIPQFTALGGVLGVFLALPSLFVAGPLTGLLLIALSAMSFVAAGAISVWHEPHEDDVPTPQPSMRLSRQVAIDDAILATLALRHANMIADEQERLRREVHEARELFRDRGWLSEPASYHVEPPELSEVRSRAAKVRSLDYDHVSFASQYEPHAGEPGRDRWLSRVANRSAHAWVLRHKDDKPRPWLVCIHGYEMGMPLIDLSAFRAGRMHHRHGVNLVLPVLPLHGPRKIGKRSGEGFIAGDFLDSIHGEAQAMWDMRRLLSWIRGQGAETIGVYGLSLGGYNASLLAELADDLACVVAGIPATDLVRLTWRHGPAIQVRYTERNGMVHDEVSELLSVVSPLVLEPKVPHDRRYIFAGVADRLVPPDQPRDLWLHWDRPAHRLVPGCSLTFGMHPAVEQWSIRRGATPESSQGDNRASQAREARSRKDRSFPAGGADFAFWEDLRRYGAPRRRASAWRPHGTFVAIFVLIFGGECRGNREDEICGLIYA